QNPEHLLIFAAGNYGETTDGCSIASPSVMKNGLAVGSSMSGSVRMTTGDMDTVSLFSGIGPTSDGRIKPDIVAPGEFCRYCALFVFTKYITFADCLLVDGMFDVVVQVYSAWNGGPGSCGLIQASGTSYSVPVAAGAAVLARQYFMDGFY
ncbi:unnamed protein product, partial [Sphacelaria rigidula]